MLHKIGSRGWHAGQHEECNQCLGVEGLGSWVSASGTGGQGQTPHPSHHAHGASGMPMSVPVGQGT